MTTLLPWFITVNTVGLIAALFLVFKTPNEER
jgi:hypothetical protein